MIRVTGESIRFFRNVLYRLYNLVFPRHLSKYLHGNYRERLIRMLILGQFHDLPVNIQIRQLWPRILGPCMNKPPRYREDEYAD